MPAVLGQRAVAEHALLDEAGALHPVQRAAVAGVHPGLDRVQAHALEAEAEHRVDRLAGQAAAPEGRQRLAAELGLPYAFASHFAPDALHEAAHVYREMFKPSAHLGAPYFAMAINVFAADTDEEGARLRTSTQQAFANLRMGRPGLLPRPVETIEDVLPPQVVAAVDNALRFSAWGAKATVKDKIAELTEPLQPDEVIVNGNIWDPDARVRSFEIAGEIFA